MSIREQFARFFRSPSSRDRDRRMAGREQGRAQSPAEEINQRESRRMAGMSAEDRAWEQASLQRHRDTQDRLAP